MEHNDRERPECRAVSSSASDVIRDVLNLLHDDRLALRIHDGAFSGMDLTARPAHR
ncbi:hypothetical protein ACWDBC_24170 [Streptomyces parvus]|uniref:hypothetical protein n=1 Tax=Streptomyces parvus TaxID=66428 RepID=UPI00331EE834